MTSRKIGTSGEEKGFVFENADQPGTETEQEEQYVLEISKGEIDAVLDNIVTAEEVSRKYEHLSQEHISQIQEEVSELSADERVECFNSSHGQQFWFSSRNHYSPRDEYIACALCAARRYK